MSDAKEDREKFGDKGRIVKKRKKGEKRVSLKSKTTKQKEIEGEEKKEEIE